MVFQKLKKSFALAVAASLVATSVPGVNYSQVLAASGKNTSASSTKQQASSKDDGVFKVTMDDTGYITADEENVAADVNTPFSWDNANVYFALTDRFYNGDKSNDHSYGRSVDEKNAADYQNRTGTFHGGDLKGMTEKIEEGYFDKLGTNAIWITAPYEQIHGGLCADKFKHYSYHGYYVLDYTNVDANMGTEEELEKFIDTAHSHGIRVIFDVVMNHAGYADAKTASEYGFGKLASNWKEIYYDWDESKYQWYNDYTGEASKNSSQGMMDPSGDWTTNWWGSNWVRAIGSRFTGYTGQEQGDDITKCLDGLPDFKTESTSDPGIPGILKAKWNKEGTYDEKVDKTKANMSARGLSASVTGYIATWLSDWVEKYGVDGFRCDTAKHIETKEWGKLSSACSKALETWRKKNSNKPGAKWTDDFWMTGEHWGHGVGKDSYYTTGGFDSMINFSYQCNYNKKPQDMDSIYADYATKINGDSGFNVLSYISSHDTPSTKSDFKYSLLSAKDGGTSGISLLLLPGGVQTYYGDESGRTEWKEPSGCTGDQIVRSDMNWNSMDTARLEVWQKVGRFRRNHIAVGAGQHTKLASSPYTFSRTYEGKATVGDEQKTDYKDAVVVCLPGQATTTDVTVGDTFGDATTVRDAYSGKTYEISGGKVSGVICDSKGVILLEIPSEGGVTSKSSVSVSPSGKTYNDDTVKVTLNAKEATDTFYQINDSEKIAFKDGDTVEIGGDTAYEEETVIKVTGKGTDSEGNAIDLSKEVKFTRDKEPAVGEAAKGFYIRMSKAAYEKVSGSTNAPYIWVYDSKGSYSGAAWESRDTMTLDASGEYYEWKDESLTTAVNVIITETLGGKEADCWRSVPDMKDGGTVSGTVEIDPSKEYTDADQIKNITLQTGSKAKVTVNYVDEAGKVLKTIYRVGLAGKEYKVYAPAALSTVPGYVLAEGEKTSETGKFAEEEATVTFKYTKKDGPVVTPTPATPTPVVTVTPSATPSATPTATPSETPTATPTQAPTQTPTEAPTQVPTQAPTEAPTQAPTEVPTQAPTEVPTQAPTEAPTQAPTEVPAVFEAKVSVSPSKSQVAGKSVTIKASATGASGSYTYKYEVENSAGTVVFKKGYTSSKSCTWKTSKAGTFVITVYAKDKATGNVTTAEKSYKITSAALVLKKVTASNLPKLNVKITATATGGKGTLKYKYTYRYKNGKEKTLKGYSTSKSIKKKFKKAGTYKLKVYVKDSSGKVKTKTITFKVKKKK